MLCTLWWLHKGDGNGKIFPEPTVECIALYDEQDVFTLLNVEEQPLYSELQTLSLMECNASTPSGQNWSLSKIEHQQKG